jgi:hypothetical protein
MTSPESFVSRWARLKRGSDMRRKRHVTDDLAPASAAETTTITGEAAIAQPEFAAVADAPFDPANLPSIDAIDVDSDIRGFLQSRVPVELTRAALRRAWASDPAIRDFIGIAENQWDFNDPDAVPGFGPLPEGYDVSGLLSQALGSCDRFAEKVPKISVSAQPSPPSITDREPGNAGLDGPRSADDEFSSLPDARREESEAPENACDAEADDRRRNQRRHGGALPRLDG